MDSSNIHSDHCLSDTDTDTNTVPSQVVPGLRSPRPGMEDDTQSFEFMAYDDSDHPDDIVETDMDTFIHKTDSGNSGNGSALSAKGDVSNNLQQKKSRKRRRPAVSSSLEAHEHIQLKNDNSTASENNNNSHSTHDHFLSVIQEQIPHLEEPVSQRKRSSSISSSKGSHTESLSPPPHLPSPPPPSPDSTMLTVRPFVPAPEPSVPRKKTLSKKPKQHSHSGPKRPRTAYIIFLEHFRQTYNELYPNTNFNDCQKLAGKKWRSLSAVEKQPWKEQERLSQKDFIHKMHGLQHAFGLVEGPPVSPPSSINSAAAVNPRHREETQNNFAQQHQQKGDDSDNEEETRKRYLEESGENMSNKIDLSDEAAHSSSTSIAVHQHQMRKILDATVPNKMTELMKGPKNAFSMFVHSMREECQKKDPTLS